MTLLAYHFLLFGMFFLAGLMVGFILAYMVIGSASKRI